MIKTARIEDILATRSRATFLHRVNFDTIAYSNIDPMREWCYEKCQGLWRCETTHALYWQFELDADATMFMLRWGGAAGNSLR